MGMRMRLLSFLVWDSLYRTIGKPYAYRWLGDLSLDQLTDDRKSWMLPFVNDPADAVHCIANFGEDEVKVAVSVSVAVKHHSNVAGWWLNRELLTGYGEAEVRDCGIIILFSCRVGCFPFFSFSQNNAVQVCLWLLSWSFVFRETLWHHTVVKLILLWLAPYPMSVLFSLFHCPFLHSSTYDSQDHRDDMTVIS